VRDDKYHNAGDAMRTLRTQCLSAGVPKCLSDSVSKSRSSQALRHSRTWTLFFVCTWALMHSCTPRQAQTNVLSITPRHVAFVPNAWSFICPQSWLGMQALDPLDTTHTHALQQALNPRFVKAGVDWSLASTNWSRADSIMALNANYNIIVRFFITNSVAESNALVATIARYTNEIWGVDAYGEPDATLGTDNTSSVTLYSSYVKMARYVINQAGYNGKIRLIGPSLSQSYVDGYCSNLYSLGVLSNLDVIAADDYFACPGNGQCDIDGPYTHPNDSPGAGYPNLAGRIADMQYWASQAGATNFVLLEEYGLYNGDTNDATATRAIVATNQACAILLSDPQGPIGSCPWNNALVNGLWDTAILNLTTCPVELTLTWQDNSVASNQSSGYIIERGTNSTPSTVIATTSAGVQTNWIDASPIPGITNYYQIAAYNSAGTSSWSNVTGGLPH
jgi:hypothetical protein